MGTFSMLLVFCAGNSSVTGEFPHKGQWRGTLVFSLVCTWTNGCVNTCRAGDLRRHCTHYDVTVMLQRLPPEITYQYYNQDEASLDEPGCVPTLAARRESRARVASSYLEWKKSVNTLMPRQNGRHFADDIFKCIFLNENVWDSIRIPLKFVPDVMTVIKWKCAVKSLVTVELPAQRPVTRSFDVFFHLYLNKRLGKQSRDW